MNEARSGIVWRRSIPRTIVRRETNMEKTGSSTIRCQASVHGAPRPALKKRMTRKANRSNGRRTAKGDPVVGGRSRGGADRGGAWAGVSAMRRGSLNRERGGLEPRHELGDDLLHDLARPAPDGEQARVA